MHDSTCFKESKLYQKLLDMRDTLLEKGWFIVGDSAYALRSFLLVPYDNAAPGSPEDSFNFYLSSCRIYSECTFGEIDMRWGIFWKRLNFGLKKSVKIIDACMLRLHNFLIDYRLSVGESNDVRSFRSDSDRFASANPDEGAGVYTDDAPDNQRGRPSAEEVLLRSEGVELRDELRDALRTAGYTRPTRIVFTRDDFNRVTINN